MGGAPPASPDGAFSPGGEALAAGEASLPGWHRWLHGYSRAGWGACRDAAGSLESGLRSWLRSHLHSLVSAALIVLLFVGTTGLAAFMSVRVAQEGRATVLAVRDAFPAAWAGMAASAPLLVDASVGAGAAVARTAAAGTAAAATAAEGNGGAGDASVGSEAPLPPAAAAVLPPWVVAYQQEALQLAQQALPAIASWAEAHFYGFMDKQNLTAALG